MIFTPSTCFGASPSGKRRPAFPGQCSADGDPAVALPPAASLLAAAPPLLLPVSAAQTAPVRDDSSLGRPSPPWLQIGIRKWYEASRRPGVSSGRSGRGPGSREAHWARFLEQKTEDSLLLLPVAKRVQKLQLLVPVTFPNIPQSQSRSRGISPDTWVELEFRWDSREQTIEQKGRIWPFLAPKRERVVCI